MKEKRRNTARISLFSKRKRTIARDLSSLTTQDHFITCFLLHSPLAIGYSLLPVLLRFLLICFPSRIQLYFSTDYKPPFFAAIFHIFLVVVFAIFSAIWPRIFLPYRFSSGNNALTVKYRRDCKSNGRTYLTTYVTKFARGGGRFGEYPGGGRGFRLNLVRKQWGCGHFGEMNVGVVQMVKYLDHGGRGL